jgi:cytochrome c553
MKRLLILLAAAAPMVASADPTVAKPEKVVTCAACHGENGVSPAPNYPNLAGQYANYIEQALHAYKSGSRKNAIMNGQAANLSDADIKELAAWFSQQKPKLYTPEANPKTAAK